MKFLTETSSGAIVRDRRMPIEMAVVEPKKGHPGRLVTSVTVWAEDVPHAAKQVRQDLDGLLAIEMKSYKSSIVDYMKRLDAEAA